MHVSNADDKTTGEDELRKSMKCAKKKVKTAAPLQGAKFAIWFDLHDGDGAVNSAMIKARLPITPQLLLPLKYLGVDPNRALQHVWSNFKADKYQSAYVSEYVNLICGRRYEGGGTWSYVNGIQWSPGTFLISDGWRFEGNSVVLDHVYVASLGGEKCDLVDETREDLKLPIGAKAISRVKELGHCWEALFKEEDGSPRFHIRGELKDSNEPCDHCFRKWTDHDEAELDGLGLFRVGRRPVLGRYL